MKIAPLTENESERLESLRELEILDSPREKQFDDLTQLIAHICDVPMAVISLVDEKRQWFKSTVGIDVCETGRDEAFCAHAILGDAPLIVEDATKDERFADNPLVTGGIKLRFYAGVPLSTHDGMHLGTLCILDTKPKKITEEEECALRTLANQASLLLDQRRSEKKLHAAQENLRAAIEESNQQRNLVSELRDVQAQFINNHSASAAFDKVLDLALRSTESEYGFIGEILADGEGSLYLKTHALTNISWDDATRKFYEENAPQGMEFRNLKTLFGHAIVTGEPLIANDPYHDSRRGGLPDGHPSLDAFLAIPVKLGSEMVGMVGIANRPSGYDESVIRDLGPLVTTYGNLIQARRNRLSREEAECRLVDNESRLARVLDASGLGYWDWDMQTGVTVFSGKWAAMLGYEQEELEPKAETWLKLCHPKDKGRVEDALNRHFENTDNVYSVEHRLCAKDGTYKWILTEGSVMAWDDEGKPARMSGIHKDIHDKKLLQVTARRLKENEILIQEVHHRVKNNLQIVSSLLSFQRSKIEEPEIAAEFDVTRGRVSAIALLHESLYQSNELDKVGLRRVINDLVRQIELAYGIDSNLIRFVINVDDIMLDFDQAGPFALIVNELVVNAIKHAFPNGRTGEVRLRASLDDLESNLYLEVSDDGMGIECEKSEGRTSLGMSLVRRLTDQLSGEFTQQVQSRGTGWLLCFPYEKVELNDE